MGATLSVGKTLIVPAVISLLIYVVSSYVLYPFYTRYRARTAQYLPLAPSLESISSRTSSLRARFQAAATKLLFPSSWRRRQAVATAADDDLEDGLDSGELGEELGDFAGRWPGPEGTTHRQEGWRPDDVGRLSRDLEEGFMDDSEDEADTPGRPR